MVFLLQVAVLLVVGGLRCKFGIVCLVLSFGRQALLHQSHYDVCRTGLLAKMESRFATTPGRIEIYGFSIWRLNRVDSGLQTFKMQKFRAHLIGPHLKITSHVF